MESFWRNAGCSDITIVFDDEEIPGHKIFLAAKSEIWKQRFFGSASSMSKDRDIVDMRGHCRLFLEMVYGLDPPVNYDDPPSRVLMSNIEERIDAIGLADMYQTKDIMHRLAFECTTTSLFRSARTMDEPTKLFLTSFVEKWTYWDSDELCKKFEQPLKAGLEVFEKERKPLPDAAYPYASRTGRISATAALGYMHGRWKAGLLTGSLYETLEEIIANTSHGHAKLMELHASFRSSMDDFGELDEFWHTVMCILLNSAFGKATRKRRHE